MKTRFTEQTGITIHRDTICGKWAHYDWNDGPARKVGPWYETQAEILADHEDYLRRAGWMKGDAPAAPDKDVRSLCGRVRLSYHPEWSTGRPFVSYLDGTAGAHFATLDDAKAQFTAQGYRFA